MTAVTKTNHEAREETASETASESAALLSEPDLGRDFTHTLLTIIHCKSIQVCFAQIEKYKVIYVTYFVDARFFESNTQVSWL